MEMQATSADRNLLLEFRGELDHHGARNALRELEMAVDAALPKVLVLDMSGITFMDSSGHCLDSAGTATNAAFGRKHSGLQCAGSGAPGFRCSRNWAAGYD